MVSSTQIQYHTPGTMNAPTAMLTCQRTPPIPASRVRRPSSSPSPSASSTTNVIYPKKVKFGSTTLLKKEATAGNAGRSVGLNRRAELEKEPAPPDLLEPLPEQIAQDDPLVMPGDPRGDAAGQHIAVHRHVDEGPRPPAGAPWAIVMRRGEADLGRRRPRPGELDPGWAGSRLRRADQGRLPLL